MLESVGSMGDEWQGWGRASRDHLPSRLREGPGVGWGKPVRRLSGSASRPFSIASEIEIAVLRDEIDLVLDDRRLASLGHGSLPDTENDQPIAFVTVLGFDVEPAPRKPITRLHHYEEEHSAQPRRGFPIFHPCEDFVRNPKIRDEHERENDEHPAISDGDLVGIEFAVGVARHQVWLPTDPSRTSGSERAVMVESAVTR